MAPVAIDRRPRPLERPAPPRALRLPGLPRRRTVPAHDLTGVTRVADEVDPREVGLAPKAITRIWTALEDLYRAGEQPAIALCVRHRGRVLVDRTIGHVRGNDPGGRGQRFDSVVATPASLFNLFSASKSITAMVVHLLAERGQLSLDDRVADHLPGFDRHGKGATTIRHLLEHTAGIPSLPEEHFDLELLGDRGTMRGLLAELRPTWGPGEQVAYHALTSGFALGEIVHEVTGRTIREVLGAEILAPLGFETLNYGVPEQRVDEVARHSLTGFEVVGPPATYIRNAVGIDFDRAIELSNEPRFLSGIVPSGNVIGTANEACRFYQLLLDGGELDGVRVLAPETVRAAVTEVNPGRRDQVLQMPVRYGQGFMLGRHRLGPYGPRSGNAFGHIGFTQVITWADPDRHLAVALLTTGKPLVTTTYPRWFKVIKAIATEVPRGATPRF